MLVRRGTLYLLSFIDRNSPHSSSGAYPDRSEAERLSGRYNFDSRCVAERSKSTQKAGGESIFLELTCSRNQPRYCVPCPRRSFPTRLIHNHERQNDVIQHAHSCRLNFQSRLLFVGEMVWAVELGDHCLLIEGHQLCSVAQRREYW
jgi:hypothetical protein